MEDIFGFYFLVIMLIWLIAGIVVTMIWRDQLFAWEMRWRRKWGLPTFYKGTYYPTLWVGWALMAAFIIKILRSAYVWKIKIY